jgi:hypothetical protein
MIDYVRPSEGIKRRLDVLELQGDKYFTLSKKGITTYVKGKPDDYETLSDWILARSNFRVIRNF